MSLMMDVQAAVWRLFGRRDGEIPPASGNGDAHPVLPLQAPPQRDRVPEMAAVKSSVPPTA
jgi:hypothetical protein